MQFRTLSVGSHRILVRSQEIEKVIPFSCTHVTLSRSPEAVNFLHGMSFYEGQRVPVVRTSTLIDHLKQRSGGPRTPFARYEPKFIVRARTDEGFIDLLVDGLGLHVPVTQNPAPVTGFAAFRYSLRMSTLSALEQLCIGGQTYFALNLAVVRRRSILPSIHYRATPPPRGRKPDEVLSKDFASRVVETR